MCNPVTSLSGAIVMERMNLSKFRAIILRIALCLVCSTYALSLVALANPLQPTTGTIIIDSTGRSNLKADSAQNKDLSTIVVTNGGATSVARNVKSTSDSGASASSPQTPIRNRVSQTKQGRRVKTDISHMFRESAPDYPEEDIERLLKALPDSVKDLYNVINTKLDPQINLTERVASHGGDDDEYSIGGGGGSIREESICKSVTRNIYPREASHQNSLVYIPNNHEFMQLIQADICQQPNEECSHLQSSLPDGMTSACYQKYAYKKLLYMDPSDKRMASDLFRYPSCCSCYIRTMPFDLRSSVGKPKASAASSAPVSASRLTPTITTESPTSSKFYLEGAFSNDNSTNTTASSGNIAI